MAQRCRLLGSSSRLLSEPFGSKVHRSQQEDEAGKRHCHGPNPRQCLSVRSRRSLAQAQRPHDPQRLGNNAPAQLGLPHQAVFEEDRDLLDAIAQTGAAVGHLDLEGVAARPHRLHLWQQRL